MGNGAMAKGPSHRAHPRLYQAVWKRFLFFKNCTQPGVIHVDATI
jgi:hypothetical protein